MSFRGDIFQRRLILFESVRGQVMADKDGKIFEDLRSQDAKTQEAERGAPVREPGMSSGFSSSAQPSPDRQRFFPDSLAKTLGNVIDEKIASSMRATVSSGSVFSYSPPGRNHYSSAAGMYVPPVPPVSYSSASEKVYLPPDQRLKIMSKVTGLSAKEIVKAESLSNVESLVKSFDDMTIIHGARKLKESADLRKTMLTAIGVSIFMMFVFPPLFFPAAIALTCIYGISNSKVKENLIFYPLLARSRPGALQMHDVTRIVAEERNRLVFTGEMDPRTAYSSNPAAEPPQVLSEQDEGLRGVGATEDLEGDLDEGNPEDVRKDLAYRRFESFYNTITGRLEYLSGTALDQDVREYAATLLSFGNTINMMSDLFTVKEMSMLSRKMTFNMQKIDRLMTNSVAKRLVEDPSVFEDGEHLQKELFDAFLGFVQESEDIFDEMMSVAKRRSSEIVRGMIQETENTRWDSDLERIGDENLSSRSVFEDAKTYDMKERDTKTHDTKAQNNAKSDADTVREIIRTVSNDVDKDDFSKIFGDFEGFSEGSGSLDNEAADDETTEDHGSPDDGALKTRTESSSS